jgi:hypothetical protein
MLISTRPAEPPDIICLRARRDLDTGGGSLCGIFTVLTSVGNEVWAAGEDAIVADRLWQCPILTKEEGVAHLQLVFWHLNTSYTHQNIEKMQKNNNRVVRKNCTINY